MELNLYKNDKRYVDKTKDNGVATAEIIPMLFLTLFYLIFFIGVMSYERQW